MVDRSSFIVDMNPAENAENGTPQNIYKIIRTFTNACNQRNLKEIKKLYQNNAVLKELKDLEEPTSSTLSDPNKKNAFRDKVIDSILNYSSTQLYDETDKLFIAAVKLDLTKLQNLIADFKKNSSTYLGKINKPKLSDSVILFVLKYGNVHNNNFLPCVALLVDAEVNINKMDGTGRTAIDYVAALYESTKNNDEAVETLKKITSLFLDKKIFKPENQRTLDFLKNAMKIDVENSESFVEMDKTTKLFLFLLKNKTEEFLSVRKINKISNSDDGENTLLQLATAATKKTDAMLPVVRHLLKNDANPNKTTEFNTLTPLEFAGFYNNAQIFEEILKNRKTKLTEKQYNNFVRWRSQPMKVKLFDLLLESDKLDPNWIYEKTGNTPLHYAVIFSNKKAIEVLLKHHTCLVDNKSSKSILDIIDSEDLEKYFDSCLTLDNYTDYFSDVNYRMSFRFNCLVDSPESTTPKEARVVSKIGQRPHLQQLLTHPFIQTFLNLKWFKVKTFFWIILCLQAIMFLLLLFFFYRLPEDNNSSWEWIVCFVLTGINFVIRAPLFTTCRTKNKRPDLFVLRRAPLHGSFEILLMVTMIGSFFHRHFRAFLFVEMPVLFLLTAGYHPRLSKWSIMLQKVFKTFTVLLTFFSLIIIGFSFGFRTLFPEDEFFHNITTSIFITYIKTTGEFNLEENSAFEDSGVFGYALFLLFAMTMSMVLVNFWTGVAVTDIDRIEKNSEVNASKNVIVFMLFVDYIFTVLLKICPRIQNYLNPLLFFRVGKGNSEYTNVNFSVPFFVNKEKQFEGGDLPARVDDDCLEKIKNHYNKLKKLTGEQEILKKLDDLSKALEEMKAAMLKNCDDGGDSGANTGKNCRKWKPKK